MFWAYVNNKKIVCKNRKPPGKKSSKNQLQNYASFLNTYGGDYASIALYFNLPFLITKAHYTLHMLLCFCVFASFLNCLSWLRKKIVFSRFHVFASFCNQAKQWKMTQKHKNPLQNVVYNGPMSYFCGTETIIFPCLMIVLMVNH